MRHSVKKTYLFNYLTYTVELVLSNEHLEVFMLCLGPKIFNEKVEVLFDFFYLIE